MREIPARLVPGYSRKGAHPGGAGTEWGQECSEPTSAADYVVLPAGSRARSHVGGQELSSHLPATASP
jgi:hypothetical protein